jgi:hypothetical protein
MIVKSVILLMIIMGTAGLYSADKTSVQSDRRFRCEQICKTRDWGCRQRALRKQNERLRRKAMGICSTFFIDCMNRCQRYSR